MNEDKNNPNNKEEKFQPPSTNGKPSSSSLSPTLTPIITKEIVTKRSSSVTEETEEDSVVQQNKRRKVPVEVFKSKEEHLPIVRQQQLKQQKQPKQQLKQQQPPLKVIITPIMGKEFHFDNLENPTIFDIKDAIYKKLDLEHEAQILTPSIATSNTIIDDSTPLRSLMGGGGGRCHSDTINLRLSIKTMTGMKFSTSLPDYEFISSELASPFSTDVEGFNGSGSADSLEQILLNTAHEGGADRRLAVVDVVSEGGRKGKKSLLVEFDGDSLANAKIIGELSSNGVIKKTIPNFLTDGGNSNSNSSGEEDGEDADADADAVVVAEDDNNNNVVPDPKEDISTYLDRAINIKEKVVEQAPQTPPAKVEDGPVRCTKCNRKCRLGGQFRCRCDLIFCGTHRYPDMHSCTFDHKAFGRKSLGKANPKLEDSHRL